MAISNNNLPECCSQGAGHQTYFLSCDDNNNPIFTEATSCVEGAVGTTGANLYETLFPSVTLCPDFNGYEAQWECSCPEEACIDTSIDEEGNPIIDNSGETVIPANQANHMWPMGLACTTTSDCPQPCQFAGAVDCSMCHTDTTPGECWAYQAESNGMDEVFGQGDWFPGGIQEGGINGSEPYFQGGSPPIGGNQGGGGTGGNQGGGSGGGDDIPDVRGMPHTCNYYGMPFSYGFTPDAPVGEPHYIHNLGWPQGDVSSQYANQCGQALGCSDNGQFSSDDGCWRNSFGCCFVDNKAYWIDKNTGQTLSDMWESDYNNMESRFDSNSSNATDTAFQNRYYSEIFNVYQAHDTCGIWQGNEWGSCYSWNKNNWHIAKIGQEPKVELYIMQAGEWWEENGDMWNQFIIWYRSNSPILGYQFHITNIDITTPEVQQLMEGGQADQQITSLVGNLANNYEPNQGRNGVAAWNANEWTNIAGAQFDDPNFCEAFSQGMSAYYIPDQVKSYYSNYCTNHIQNGGNPQMHPIPADKLRMENGSTWANAGMTMTSGYDSYAVDPWESSGTYVTDDWVYFDQDHPWYYETYGTSQIVLHFHWNPTGVPLLPPNKDRHGEFEPLMWFTGRYVGGDPGTYQSGICINSATFVDTRPPGYNDGSRQNAYWDSQKANQKMLAVDEYGHSLMHYNTLGACIVVDFEGGAGEFIPGCTDNTACNYDSEATIQCNGDNSCCTYDRGCTCNYPEIYPIAYCQDVDGDGWGNQQTSTDYCPDANSEGGDLTLLNEYGTPLWINTCWENPNDEDDSCPCPENDMTPGGPCVTCHNQCRALTPEEEWYDVDSCGVCILIGHELWNESCRDCAGDVLGTKYMDNCGYCVDYTQAPDFNINPYGFCKTLIGESHLGTTDHANDRIGTPLTGQKLANSPYNETGEFTLGNITPVPSYTTKIKMGKQYNVSSNLCVNDNCARTPYDCGSIFSINGTNPSAACVELQSTDINVFRFETTNIFDQATSLIYEYLPDLAVTRNCIDEPLYTYDNVPPSWCPECIINATPNGALAQETAQISCGCIDNTWCDRIDNYCVCADGDESCPKFLDNFVDALSAGAGDEWFYDSVCYDEMLEGSRRCNMYGMLDNTTGVYSVHTEGSCADFYQKGCMNPGDPANGIPTPPEYNPTNTAEIHLGVEEIQWCTEYVTQPGAAIIITPISSFSLTEDIYNISIAGADDRVNFTPGDNIESNVSYILNYDYWDDSDWKTSIEMVSDNWWHMPVHDDSNGEEYPFVRLVDWGYNSDVSYAEPYHSGNPFEVKTKFGGKVPSILTTNEYAMGYPMFRYNKLNPGNDQWGHQYWTENGLIGTPSVFAPTFVEGDTNEWSFIPTVPVNEYERTSLWEHVVCIDADETEANTYGTNFHCDNLSSFLNSYYFYKSAKFYVLPEAAGGGATAQPVYAYRNSKYSATRLTFSTNKGVSPAEAGVNNGNGSDMYDIWPQSGKTSTFDNDDNTSSDDAPLFYAFKTHVAGTVPVYECSMNTGFGSSIWGDIRYDTNASCPNGAHGGPWTNRGTAFYAYDIPGGAQVGDPAPGFTFDLSLNHHTTDYEPQQGNSTYQIMYDFPDDIERKLKHGKLVVKLKARGVFLRNLRAAQPGMGIDNFHAGFSGLFPNNEGTEGLGRTAGGTGGTNNNQAGHRMKYHDLTYGDFMNAGFMKVYLFDEHINDAFSIGNAFTEGWSNWFGALPQTWWHRYGYSNWGEGNYHDSVGNQLVYTSFGLRDAIAVRNIRTKDLSLNYLMGDWMNDNNIPDYWKDQDAPRGNGRNRFFDKRSDWSLYPDSQGYYSAHIEISPDWEGLNPVIDGFARGPRFFTCGKAEANGQIDGDAVPNPCTCGQLSPTVTSINTGVNRWIGPYQLGQHIYVGDNYALENIEMEWDGESDNNNSWRPWPMPKAIPIQPGSAVDWGEMGYKNNGIAELYPNFYPDLDDPNDLANNYLGNKAGGSNNSTVYDWMVNSGFNLDAFNRKKPVWWVSDTQNNWDYGASQQHYDFSMWPSGVIHWGTQNGVADTMLMYSQWNWQGPHFVCTDGCVGDSTRQIGGGNLADCANTYSSTTGNDPYLVELPGEEGFKRPKGQVFQGGPLLLGEHNGTGQDYTNYQNHWSCCTAYRDRPVKSLVLSWEHYRLRDFWMSNNPTNLGNAADHRTVGRMHPCQSAIDQKVEAYWPTNWDLDYSNGYSSENFLLNAKLQGWHDCRATYGTNALSYNESGWTSTDAQKMKWLTSNMSYSGFGHGSQNWVREIPARNNMYNFWYSNINENLWGKGANYPVFAFQPDSHQTEVNDLYEYGDLPNSNDEWSMDGMNAWNVPMNCSDTNSAQTNFNCAVGTTDYATAFLFNDSEDSLIPNPGYMPKKGDLVVQSIEFVYHDESPRQNKNYGGYMPGNGTGMDLYFDPDNSRNGANIWYEVTIEDYDDPVSQGGDYIENQYTETEYNNPGVLYDGTTKQHGQYHYYTGNAVDYLINTGMNFRFEKGGRYMVTVRGWGKHIEEVPGDPDSTPVDYPASLCVYSSQWCPDPILTRVYIDVEDPIYPQQTIEENFDPYQGINIPSSTIESAKLEVSEDDFYVKDPTNSKSFLEGNDRDFRPQLGCFYYNEMNDEDLDWEEVVGQNFGIVEVDYDIIDDEGNVSNEDKTFGKSVPKNIWRGIGNRDPHDGFPTGIKSDAYPSGWTVNNSGSVFVGINNPKIPWPEDKNDPYGDTSVIRLVKNIQGGCAIPSTDDSHGWARQMESMANFDYGICGEGQSTPNNNNWYDSNGDGTEDIMDGTPGWGLNGEQWHGTHKRGSSMYMQTPKGTQYKFSYWAKYKCDSMYHEELVSGQDYSYDWGNKPPTTNEWNERFMNNVNVNSGTPRGWHSNTSDSYGDWNVGYCNLNKVGVRLYKGRQENEPPEQMYDWSDWGSRGSKSSEQMPDDGEWHYYETFVTQNSDGEVYPSLSWSYGIGMMELQLYNIKIEVEHNFSPDVDVRAIQSLDGEQSILTEYYDENVDTAKYFENTAPVEVQFFFYARQGYSHTSKTESLFEERERIEFDDLNLYVAFINWGDDTQEYFDKPVKLSNDEIFKHEYKKSGIYEVTGYMFNHIRDLGVSDFKKFLVRINITEDPNNEHEFSALGGKKHTYIPYKDTVPVVGGISRESVYQKVVERQSGFTRVFDETGNEINYSYLPLEFRYYSDKLKSEMALVQLDETKLEFTEVLPIWLQNYYDVPVDEDGNLTITDDDTPIFYGYDYIFGELGDHIGEIDLGQVRYYKKPKQMWEMLGFTDSFNKSENAHAWFWDSNYNGQVYDGAPLTMMLKNNEWNVAFNATETNGGISLDSNQNLSSLQSDLNMEDFPIDETGRIRGFVHLEIEVVSNYLFPTYLEITLGNNMGTDFYGSGLTCSLQSPPYVNDGNGWVTGENNINIVKVPLHMCEYSIGYDGGSAVVQSDQEYTAGYNFARIEVYRTTYQSMNEELEENQQLEWFEFINEGQEWWKINKFTFQADPDYGDITEDNITHPGNPGHYRYWKNIIPKNYGFGQKQGIEKFYTGIYNPALQWSMGNVYSCSDCSTMDIGHIFLIKFNGLKEGGAPVSEVFQDLINRNWDLLPKDETGRYIEKITGIGWYQDQQAWLPLWTRESGTLEDGKATKLYVTDNEDAPIVTDAVIENDLTEYEPYTPNIFSNNHGDNNQPSDSNLYRVILKYNPQSGEGRYPITTNIRFDYPYRVWTTYSENPDLLNPGNWISIHPEIQVYTDINDIDLPLASQLAAWIRGIDDNYYYKIDTDASQQWVGTNDYNWNYYYPITPKLNRARDFKLTKYGWGTDYNIIKPFGNPARMWDKDDMYAPISNKIIDEKDLIVDLDFGQIAGNKITDIAGMGNVGVKIADYKIEIDEETKSPKSDEYISDADVSVEKGPY